MLTLAPPPVQTPAMFTRSLNKCLHNALRAVWLRPLPVRLGNAKLD